MLGKVKLNLLPLPNLLSTQIFPPFFSTNSLQRISPKPVPVSSSVPASDFLSVIENKFLRTSFLIPTPLSSTVVSIKPSIFFDDRTIEPPLFVYFIALLTKLRSIVFTQSSSAKILFWGSILLFMVLPLLLWVKV